MVIDTSAVAAILLDEPDMARFAEAIATAERRLISTATVLELTMVIEARLGEKGVEDIDTFLDEAAITLVPFDATQLAKARDAWRRFGKGRHPAKLNFGDCIAYALSKTSGLPLLFKGEDFVHTDVVSA
jgi:ribonuclease VapC